MDRSSESDSSESLPAVDVSGQEWGSDFVADLLEAFGFEFVSFNPGASFRGLEESIVNYNDNTPTVVETAHEGISVAVAHGFAKATGEPAVCVLHNVVGTMHGSMAVFNAYVDRVPILVLSGTGPMRKTERRPWIEWIHTALVQGNLVRDFVKWDDQPFDVDGVAESLIRAYRVANTAPKGPTYVTLDHDVQECALDEPMEIPALDAFVTPPRIGTNEADVAEAATLLFEADDPLIVVDQVGDSRAAVDHLVALAEALAIPVYDPRKRRFNFPNTHDLYFDRVDPFTDTDVVLAVDAWSVEYALTDGNGDLVPGNDYELIDVGMRDFEVSSLTADYYSLNEPTVTIAGNSELALESLLAAVREGLDGDDDQTRCVEARREHLADLQADRRAETAAEVEAAWDEDPISLPRLASEVWEVVKDDDWVLVNGILQGWPHRIWEIDEFDAYVGGTSGGAGVGYGPGAAIGGALAYQESDRIPINLQSDGSLMYYLSSLWTVGHYDLPLFTVVHNNGSYYNSTNHRMELAAFRDRDASYESALIGTGLWDPVPDYAGIAESMGVAGYGPVEDPDELAPTLEAAWTDAQSGQPVVVDVVAQPR